MTPNITELDKIYLKNKGDYSQLVDWKYRKNGRYLYKVINDHKRTMDLYEIDENGTLEKIL